MLKKNKNNFYDLCKDFIEEKSKAEYFDKVIKKEFYKNISEAFENDEQKIILSDEKIDDVSYSVTKVESKKIIYDLEKLKKDLSKESYKHIITKKVSITNQELLLTTLKDAGISLSEVKKFLSIEDVVDEKTLEQDLQVGKIDKKIIVKDSKVENSKEPYYIVKELNGKDKK